MFGPAAEANRQRNPSPHFHGLGFKGLGFRGLGLRVTYPQAPEQFLFGVTYIKSYKVIPKKNYYGAYG